MLSSKVVWTDGRPHPGNWPGFERNRTDAVVAASEVGLIPLRVATFASALAYRGIAGNRWYVDITSERPRHDAAGIALLAAYGGLGEIAGHPGYVDEALKAADTLVAERHHDLRLLTDPLLRRALGSEAVRWRVL